MTIQSKVVITDLSFYQDDDTTPYKVDFRAMRNGGVDGSILRAGQNQWVDEDYLDYARNADLIGHPRGAYWFYDSRTPPEVQAAIFAEVINMLPFPSLGIWGDYEERYGGPWGGGAHFRVFMEELQRRFPGKLIGVYTAPSYWETETTLLQKGWFKQFPLWIAHYYVKNPTVPIAWLTWILWQYTDRGDGKRLGVESYRLDMNIFNGTFEEYKRFFGLPEGLQPIEPSQEGEEGMFEVWSDVYAMTLRAQPNAFGTKLGETIPRGTRMRADMIVPPNSGGMAGDKWAHVIIVGGVAREGYVAIIHNGVSYCNYIDITQPPTNLPTISITYEADGYPTLVVDWKPLE